MKNIGLIIFSISILISCQTNQSTDGYVVNVVARNIPDSTKALIYLDMETILDSAIVINEQIQFKGKVERPRRVLLRMESVKESRMFWLENNKISITGEKGNMANSIVVGSKTQEEAELLLKRKDSIYKEMESLRDIITDSNYDSLLVVHGLMEEKAAEIDKNFIIDYPDSYESLTALSSGTKEVLGVAETGKLLSLMNEELQSSEEGKSIRNFIQLSKSVKVGEKYVDFEQTNIKGQPIRFSDLTGKYTLLEFWSSDCGPCRTSNPELVKEYELYKDRGFVIIGVSLDANKEKWVQAVKKDGLVWENLSDLKGWNNEVAIMYGVIAIPENFLIDENGIIIARYLRGEKLKLKLKELFD